MSVASPVHRLQGQLIVSCQPVPDGPFDHPEIVAAYVRAALTGGSEGFRIEGAANIRMAREATDKPIIGLIKRPFGEVPHWITGTVADVDATIDAGADIVAIDATDRSRPTSVEALFQRARDRDVPVLADVSTSAEARKATRLGADAIATTLSLDCKDDNGRPCPDFGLIGNLSGTLDIPILAEGNVRTPDDAAQAKRAGAWAVVVGSAITRPEFVTRWFADAMGDGDETSNLKHSTAGSK
ncbi:MAG: N-acetylmannosamine-6-phosphate 2-epimerase [Pseudomonadota bacterium]